MKEEVIIKNINIDEAQRIFNAIDTAGLIIILRTPT
jgi:hypothetical protein